MTFDLEPILHVACPTGVAACKALGLHFWSTGVKDGNYWAVDGSGGYFMVIPIREGAKRIGWAAYACDKDGMDTGEVRLEVALPEVEPVDEQEALF